MTQITLATLPEATAQQVFDQVAAHLLAQNAKSASGEDGNCLYHGPDDRMCAAGCLIAEGEYDEDFEDRDWSSLVDDQRVPSEHGDLIQELQAVHDHKYPSAWRDRLAHVAREHGLEFSP